MNKKINILLKIFVGLFILFLLFYKVGFSKIYSVFLTLNLWQLLPVLIIITINNIIGPLNLIILLAAIKKRLPFWLLTKYYLLSWSIGLLIPGKIGEFSIIYYLKQENISIGEGLVVSFLDKIITALVIFTIAIFGFFIFFEKSQAIFLIILIAFSLILLMIVVIWGKSRGLIKKYILRKYESHFAGFSKTLFSYWKAHKFALFLNVIVTIAKRLLMAYGVFFMFLSFNFPVSYITLLLITSITSIISYIPITISGLGITESMMVVLFSRVGVPIEITAGVALLSLFLNYLLAGFSLLTFRVKNSNTFF